MGKESEWTFLQRRSVNGLEAHEKMLNIISQQRNANQNYNEMSLNTHYDG